MLQSTSIDIADKRYNWLKIAITDPEWLATQREAWEATNKPESLGQPLPRFLLLTEQNPERLLHQLATHFQQLAERHRATTKSLRQIAEAYAASHWMPEQGKPTQS